MPYDLPEWFYAQVKQLESSNNPEAVTGKYRGLYQMGPDEIAKYGGYGEKEGRALLQDRAAELDAKLGRKVTPAEVYLAHQQGVGGAVAHLGNPDRPAWESVYSTREGREKGPGWSKEAVWGNLPQSVKDKYGSVEKVPSGDFANYWGGRIDERAPLPQVAALRPSPPIGAPIAPEPVAKAAQPMGSLPAFSFSMGGSSPPTASPSPPAPGAQALAAPKPIIDIANFQQLPPLVWQKLLRG